MLTREYSVQLADLSPADVAGVVRDRWDGGGHVSDLVTAGKLKSTDGVYGIRFAHNTEAVGTGLKVTKP